MTRTFALLLALLFAGSAAPADAARRVTIDQLEQTLREVRQKPDADFAWQIADLELTERIDAQKVAVLESLLPGEKSRQMLHALADEAAFLDPAPSEIPAKAVPDLTAQRRIMGLVVAYVSNSIPQLPNFFATRNTTRYEDTPQLQTPESFVPYQPFHVVDRTEAMVLYRNGREVAREALNEAHASIYPLSFGATMRGCTPRSQGSRSGCA
jgi:hypothetical protein